MHNAAYGTLKGAFEIVKYLVEHGADINKKNNKNYTPIMHAVEMNRTTLRQSRRARDTSTVTCHLKILNYLIEKGADTNHKDYASGMTFLSLCEDADRDKHDKIYEEIIRKLKQDQGDELPEIEDKEEIVSNKGE